MNKFVLGSPGMAISAKGLKLAVAHNQDGAGRCVLRRDPVHAGRAKRRARSIHRAGGRLAG